MKKLITAGMIVLTIFACKKEEKDNIQDVSGFRAIYDGNGQTSGEVPVDANVYQTGDWATVMGNPGNLQKDGFSFIGWNEKADGTGTNFSTDERIRIDKNSIKLYANWTDKNVYYITYHGNGNSSGSAPVDNTGYLEDSFAKILDNTGNLEKDGLQFSGWSFSQFSPGGSLILPGYDLKMKQDVTLYAHYSTGGSAGEYVGFDIAGYCATKSGIDKSWKIQDDYHKFGANLVDVVWNGSEFVGFDIAGYCATKSDLDKSWKIQDDYHDFGANLICVVWNGFEYVGFDIAGYCATKSGIDKSWKIQDDYHKFGANLVEVVWNGFEYVGFDIAGYCATKSGIDKSWKIQDDYHKFGANLVTVSWNGNEYVGFDIAGYCATKSGINKSWKIQDDYHKFGANLVTCVYR